MSRKKPSRALFFVLGIEIARARARSGLTQQALATALGLRQSNVAALESGASGLSVEMLVKVAHALEVDPGALLPSLDRIRAEFGDDLADLRKPIRMA